ncbi:hypothetical protein [Paenibacillus profundus]|uniref:hypothetical protein n=1 Tax=Paenibacillus profundus TaxID=1173085 RepID=UPI001F2A6D11|nr:hypothetical protein [Paenibacillus profundus]
MNGKWTDSDEDLMDDTRNVQRVRTRIIVWRGGVKPACDGLGALFHERKKRRGTS